MHYIENEGAIPIRLHCNELCALCLTKNVLCRGYCRILCTITEMRANCLYLAGKRCIYLDIQRRPRDNQWLFLSRWKWTWKSRVVPAFHGSHRRIGVRRLRCLWETTGLLRAAGSTGAYIQPTRSYMLKQQNQIHRSSRSSQIPRADHEHCFTEIANLPESDDGRRQDSCR